MIDFEPQDGEQQIMQIEEEENYVMKTKIIDTGIGIQPER